MSSKMSSKMSSNMSSNMSSKMLIRFKPFLTPVHLFINHFDTFFLLHVYFYDPCVCVCLQFILHPKSV